MSRGHRTLPHTADVILEAWGSDLPACFEEAVAALAGICVDSSRARIVERRTVHLAADPVESQLFDLLEEAIFYLDTDEAVPVAVEVHPSDNGRFEATILLADRTSVAPTGALPKAISLSDLAVSEEAGEVHCHFLVDV